MILGGLGSYVFPMILLGVPLYAFLKGVPVYETFVEGAGEGLKMAFRTLPYMVATFVAISCFTGSGALDYFARAFTPVLAPLGLPTDMIPLVLIRPISGSGALAVTGSLLQTHGPDSRTGFLASILQGATDTTFYVVTLYFGAVGVKKTGRALISGLVGDACGFLAGLFLWKALVK